MKITRTKTGVIIAGVLAMGLSLTGCYNNDEYIDRKEKQKTTTLEESLEKANLEKKLERENDPNAVRYVYLLSFAQIIGYYVIEGKVSSSGSQLAPEQEIIRYMSEPNVVDSAQDDGTYGAGDPGNFFFTTEGVMVETDLNYIISDSPIPVDVPRLNEDAPAEDTAKAEE